MKKIVSAILSAVIAFSSLCTTAIAAENTTPSGVYYENIGAEIESFAKENEDSYVSFATTVFCGDEVLYSKHFGYIDRKNNIVADENSVYEWGSISKMFVWVSVMQLYEQGKLDLNADIQTYLPKDFFKKLKYDEPITMMNLMNHNAGWEETKTTIEVSDEKDIISLEEALRKTEPVQVFKPGEITAYSNWGASLAAYIVERVSGMDYAEYLHKNVLEPLGMEHTAVSSDYRDNKWVREQREKANAYLITYNPVMDTVTNKDLGTAMSYILLYPSGSVTGTLADITKFAQAFVDDQCPLFEKQETLDLMLSASDFYGESDIAKNCHGLWPTEYAVSTIGHGGNTYGGSANLVFDKESKIGVVVLTNIQNEAVFCYEIPSLIFGSFKNNPIYINAKINKRNDISGNYVASRGIFSGSSKILSCLNYLPLSVSENNDEFVVADVPAMVRIGDNLYYIPDSNTFFYASKTSDGTVLLESQTMDYVKKDNVGYEFIAVIIFAFLVVITLVLLIVKGIKKLVKKYKSIPAGKAILAGQLAMIAIGIVLVIILVAIVPTAVNVIMCIASGASAVVCLVALVFIVKAIFTEKKIKKILYVRYVLSVICNLFVIGFVVYFQLFNFWV